MQIDARAIAESLKKLKAKAKASCAPVGPSGLPRIGENGDTYTGTYEGENLTDPGFNHNGVVGTGSGPVIGENRSTR